MRLLENRKRMTGAEKVEINSEKLSRMKKYTCRPVLFHITWDYGLRVCH